MLFSGLFSRARLEPPAEPNPKRVFVSEYLIDLNATQAAIRAGYSANRAAEIGHQLLHITTVSNAIARAKAERSRRTGIVADRVLIELARIAFVNIADVIDLWTGLIRSNATADDLASVAFIKNRGPRAEKENGYTESEVRLFDKLKALDMLARHLGMYDQNTSDSEEEQENRGVIILPAIVEVGKEHLSNLWGPCKPRYASNSHDPIKTQQSDM